MEKLIAFRIFAAFPLFGLLLPDLSTAFVGSFHVIPPVHIYIECFLLVCIAACTLRIAYLNKLNNTSGV
jgi:hypothetical protein